MKKYLKDALLILLIIVLLFFTGCACGGYCGDCFDAKISGVEVVPLTSKSLLSPYKKKSKDVIFTKWQTEEPVDGNIDIQFSVTRSDQKEWIGDDPVMDIIVIPLGHQQLDTEQKLTKTNNVRIKGQASFTVSNVLKSNELPSGNYIFKLTIRGDNNWDRKKIFVTVK